MRQEQRGMASKSAELEMEMNEHGSVADVIADSKQYHKNMSHVTQRRIRWVDRLLVFLLFKLHFFPPPSLVIDTLREVDPSRKCFRLVGGVLVERTVKEVLPALETNKEQVMDEKRNKLNYQ